mgnify:FL=1|tara:strand:+ start:1269 stop:1556 length:288 start_codon:yes stop_codon:yes gene_type:complete
MTKKIVRPILPIAPDQYDQVFVNQLARTLEQLIDEVRSADVNFQGISGSGAANILEAGDFYVGEAGFIRIVEKTEIYSGSVQGTTAVGTVTIVTS